jgi:cell division protein FtsW
MTLLHSDPKGATDAKEVERSSRQPLLQRPLASYNLLLGVTLLLLSLGLVMVFSASSVRSYDTYGSSFSIALRQGIYIAIGLPIMFAASRVPLRFWRMAGYPLLLVAVFLLVLVLVPGVGTGVDGAVRWIALPGGFNLQPSEFAKLAIVLWGSDLLVRKKKLLGDWKHLFIPLIPVSVLLLMLIMLEPDLGTTLATTSVLVALLWTVGTPVRWFAPFVATIVTLAGVLAVAEPYRFKRLVSFIDPCSPEHRLEGGYQACQGLLALSSGGVFGRGLGASREKWSGGLPNAHTDYVFGIIGEELGLLGTFTVLILFGVLAYTGVRIAQRASDPFIRLAASGVTAWLSIQAFINLGAVVGVLPITGIPLPFVSFGGSALLTTLLAVGMLLSFARQEPGAQAALAARKGGLRRTLGQQARVPVPRRPMRSRPALTARPIRFARSAATSRRR